MNTLADRQRELAIPDIASPPDRDEAEQPDIVRYWRAINRNKWRIIALVVSVGVLAALIAFSLTPTYRSTATLLVEAQKQKLVSIEEVYNSMAGGSLQYYHTQQEILKSRELATKLVRRLKLTEHPLYDPRQQQPPLWKQWLPDGFMEQGPAAASSAERIEQAVTDSVRKHIGVQLVRNSQLVNVSFVSPDRELAAKVPNALAEIYIESDLQSRMGMTQKAMTLLNTQAEDLRKKLNESEQALQAFRERERIIETKGLAQSGMTGQIDDLQKQLLDARARRAEAENTYGQVMSATRAPGSVQLEALPAMQRYPLVLRAKEAEADAEKRLNEASKRYGPEHPRMLAAEADLKSARTRLARQLETAAQTVTREFDAARAKEQTLERALNTARGEVQNLNRKEFELASLERNVKTNRELYDMFVQRFKETNLSGEMQSAIARVIDPAIVPALPYGPNKRLIVGMSLLSALLLAISLALLIERLNNTVKTTQDVESRLGVAAVGVLPLTKTKRGTMVERLFLDDPQTTFAEAVRTVRSGVLLSALDSPKKIVLVTSSVPGEGKTTVASNLAFALSQVKKTLLIDADMRRPKVGRMLGGDKALLGLSDLCAGTAEVAKCLYDVKGTEVSVLPAGRVPPNPQELLASHRFAETLKLLEGMFDIIVIDSPPVQLVSDAVVLSHLVTEVLYVVKADETPFPLARRGVRALQRANAPVTGVVLNMLNVLRADKYYGEYSGYGRRYHSKKYGYGYTGK